MLRTVYSQAAILPLGVSAARALRQHRRAVRLPGVLLLAHPLQPHRPAGQRHRQQRRVGRGIVGAVMAVAARALDMDAADLVGAPVRSARASAARSGKTPWLCVHTVSAPSSNSPTAQDGPIEPCIW